MRGGTSTESGLERPNGFERRAASRSLRLFAEHEGVMVEHSRAQFQCCFEIARVAILSYARQFDIQNLQPRRIQSGLKRLHLSRVQRRLLELSWNVHGDKSRAYRVITRPRSNIDKFCRGAVDQREMSERIKRVASLVL